MTVVQRTPNLGLGIRLTPLAPEPEPAAPPAPCPDCPPARVLDPAGEVVAELGCGEEYQYECPVCPPGDGDCSAAVDVMWAADPSSPLQLTDDYGLFGPVGVLFPDFKDPVHPDHAEPDVGIYGADHRRLAVFGTPNGIIFGVPRSADGSAVSGLIWTWELREFSQNYTGDPDPYYDDFVTVQALGAGSVGERIFAEGSLLVLDFSAADWSVASSGGYGASIIAKAYCGETEVGELYMRWDVAY